MMLPARTRSPPNFLMPRYFGLLSRPFREEPTPFLCAMVASVSAEIDVVDADFGKALPVPLLAGVVLPALELEDDDLLAAAVPHDLADDPRPVDLGRARLHRVAVGAEQHVGELDLAALVPAQRRELVCLTRLDTELPPAGPDDRVRHGFKPLKLKILA